MAMLAFLDRIRINTLSEDFAAAQCQIESFRRCIFDDPPPNFDLKCCVQFLEEDETRTCQLEVNEQMSFGQLKQQLKEKFPRLLDYRLTIVVGKRIPLDILTLQMLNVTRNGCTVYIVASDKSQHKSRLSVNKQYKVAREENVRNTDIQQAMDMLDLMEGLVSQKNMMELTVAIDAFKDRIENEQLMTEYNLLSPVIARLVVEVEDIEQQRGKIVIPRVLWTTSFEHLKVEMENRYAIPRQLQRWFALNEIRDDHVKLCDVFSEDDGKNQEIRVVLYLVTPESAGITAERIQELYEKLKKRFVNEKGANDGGFRQRSLADDSGDDNSSNDAEEEQDEFIGPSTNQMDVGAGDRYNRGSGGGGMGFEDFEMVNYGDYASVMSMNTIGEPTVAPRREARSASNSGLESGQVVGGVRKKTTPNRQESTNNSFRRQGRSQTCPRPSTRERVKVTWNCSNCSVETNRPHFKICEVCGVGARPDDFVIPDWYEPDEEENRKLEEEALNEQLTLQRLKADELGVEMDQGPPQALPRLKKVNLKWQCEVCSYSGNRPHFNFCEVCARGTRPEGFQIPEWYEPEADERRKLDEEKQNEQLTLEMLKAEEEQYKAQAQDHFLALQMAEHSAGCFPNTEAFTCPVCFCEIEVGEGVTLRQCHHTICNDCLIGHIRASENGVNVKCPITDVDDNACEQLVEQSEMRALLSEENFDKLLQAAVSQAEAAEPNSFHCKTADCAQWCIVTEEVNFFECPSCEKVNCLTCAAIHAPMNCKEYQDDLKVKAANDEAAKATEAMLNQLVTDGEALHCPGCKVIVQKKSGCDWMQCSMCKTEICWATKGPRWGPGGRGDTSGGCKCRNPNKCHPNCGNCH